MRSQALAECHKHQPVLNRNCLHLQWIAEGRNACRLLDTMPQAEFIAS